MNDTRHTDAEYAAAVEDEAARQGKPCVVKVDRAYYTVTAPIEVWVAVDWAHRA